MTSLNNLSVGRKLILVFSIIFLMVAGLGSFAIKALSDMNRAATDVTETRLPAVEKARSLQFLVSSLRTNQMAYMVAQGDDFDATREAVETIEEVVYDTRESYEKLMSSPEEREAYGVFTDNFAGFSAGMTRIAQLSQAGRIDEARALTWGETQPFYLALVQSTDRLTELSQTQAAKASANIDHTNKVARIGIIAALIAVLIIAAIAGALLRQTIAAPLLALRGTMERLARDDTAVEIPGHERKDEVGAMARAVLVFKDGMIESERLRARENAERIGKEERANTLAVLTHDFDTQASSVINDVAEAAGAMQVTASQLTQAADSTAEQSTAVAAAAQEASTNVQTVAAAAEELTSSIGEISRQIAQASQVSQKAVDQAAHTTGIVGG
ncbi:MCP four helix bundle domain-containing protein, partial [Rhodospirillum rubrum]